MEEYKGKYTAAAAQESSTTEFTPGETFGGLHSHEKIKAAPSIRVNAYQAYIRAELKPTPDPLAY